jgi:hypothetical protein
VCCVVLAGTLTGSVLVAAVGRDAARGLVTVPHINRNCMRSWQLYTSQPAHLPGWTAWF